MAKKLLSQSAYARHAGVSAQTIRKDVKVGKITLVEGKIDPVRADKERAEKTDWAMKNKPKKPNKNESTGAIVEEGVTMYQARTQKMAYEAKLAKLKYEEEIGKVVDTLEIQNQLFSSLRSVRDSILNIAPRVSAIVAAELGMPDKAFRVNKIIEKEVHDILSDMANIKLKVKGNETS